MGTRSCSPSSAPIYWLLWTFDDWPALRVRAWQLARVVGVFQVGGWVCRVLLVSSSGKIGAWVGVACGLPFGHLLSPVGVARLGVTRLSVTHLGVMCLGEAGGGLGVALIGDGVGESAVENAVQMRRCRQGQTCFSSASNFVNQPNQSTQSAHRPPGPSLPPAQDLEAVPRLHILQHLWYSGGSPGWGCDP